MTGQSSSCWSPSKPVVNLPFIILIDDVINKTGGSSVPVIYNIKL